MTRGRRTALALLTALLLWPAGALAQGSPNALTPFNNPAPTTTTTTPTVTTSGTSTSGGGFTGTDGVLIGLGALLVLGGISFFIWHDARKRAPVRHRAAAATAGASGSARQRQKPRKLSPAERKRRKRGRAR